MHRGAVIAIVLAASHAAGVDVVAERRAVAVAAAGAPPRGTCVFHLHVPKCAGTFVWRFLRSRFCPEEASICNRAALAPPPRCQCVVNPITDDAAVLAAIPAGGYRFASAHSRTPFQKSSACALAVWFRDPVARVHSHFGYFTTKRGHNITSLSSLYGGKRSPHWASNQQWALLLPDHKVAGFRSPSDRERKRAAEELRSLAFVGIVEDMAASLCAFASAYLGPKHAADLCAPAVAVKKENVAKKSTKLGDKDRAAVASHNKYDAALYDLARAEFEARQRNRPR
jgi:hypothetical protein